MKKIYFDNNATTPVIAPVRRAIQACLEDDFGNPSSDHGFGEAAKHVLERARDQVAGLINAPSSRLFFTSGGTEANNLAIFSAAAANPARKHLITSAVEHPSVLRPLQYLREQGYELEILEVDEDGGLDLDRLRAAIRPDTGLVSLLGGNNETGVIWPLAEISALCREKKVLFHCDSVQLAGKEPIDAQELEADYLTLAAHKLHGPKGIGALYARRRAPLTPMILGAGQEQGLRAGTENVAGAAGFGTACELAGRDLSENRRKIQKMRDQLEQEILATIPETRVNGQGQPRLANTCNVSFRHCPANALIQELDDRGIAVSAHSACHSGDLNPSHVLTAMRIPEEYLHGTLRISLGSSNTMAEVETLLNILPGLVRKFRHGFAA
ncbi:MAG: cysteine desulfurase [Desulfobacterales bacterium]|nr:cysteine desulfurase [Desulfobacterales bacterium]